MDLRENWLGLLHTYGRGAVTETLAAALDQANTGAYPFLGITQTGAKYWIKTPGNPQGNYSLAAERIVSAIGLLIDAPVRPAVLIEIPAGMESYAYGDGRLMQKCIGHGSLLLEGDVVESWELDHVEKDHNAFRQPALIALWEWCLGDDEQWLYSGEEDFSIWSFDHGYWFDSHERPWSTSDLIERVTAKAPSIGSVTGMDGAQFHETAGRVEAITPEQLLEAVASVPVSWDVASEDLETVAWFLYVRRQHVADSLRRAATRASRN